MNRFLKMLALTVGVFVLGSFAANAATDMTGVVSAVSGYWDAVQIVAIAILLFVVGRKVVRKI